MRYLEEELSWDKRADKRGCRERVLMHEVQKRTPERVQNDTDVMAGRVKVEAPVRPLTAGSPKRT